MKKLVSCLLAAVFSFGMTTAFADTLLSIRTSGGSWNQAMVDAWFDPFAEKKNIDYVTSSNMKGLPLIKAQSETGKVTTDLIFLYESTVMNGCDQGLFIKVDEMFDREDYLDNVVSECGVGVAQYATIIASNEGSGIDSVEDFFNPEIPGKRGMTRWAEHTFELALLGAGIEPDRVNNVLKTEEGQKLALETIRGIDDKIIWFESGAQANQLLIDEQVVATMGYDARFNNAIDSGYDINILWDGFVTGFSVAAIPKGAPNEKLAIELLQYMVGDPSNLRIMDYIRYSPVLKKIDTDEISDKFSRHPDNSPGMVISDMKFWAEYSGELNKMMFQIINK